MLSAKELLEDKFLVKVGTKAPDFILNSDKGMEWRLSDHLGKVVALLFYPKNETLVCTRQLCSVRNNWAEYLKTKAEVVAISPGTIEEHLQFSEKHEFPMQLLADGDRAVTRIYSNQSRFIPVSFTRAIVIVDAKGYVRTKQVMLRAFRPSDTSVITSIYAARADANNEKYELLLENYKKDAA